MLAEHEEAVLILNRERRTTAVGVVTVQPVLAGQRASVIVDRLKQLHFGLLRHL